MSIPTNGSIGLYAQMACIWEVMACKVGNVHRQADFADLGLLDFLLSAAAVAPILDTAHLRPVGDTVLHSVRATRLVAASNTNLGIILLLAPLASVPLAQDLPTGLVRVLDRLTLADTHAVFQAIRLAQPAALGQVAEQDVKDEPTLPLRQVMALAADRDLVARQFANAFQEVMAEGLPMLRQTWQEGRSLENIIITTHLHFLANHLDSLIVRKQGIEEGQETRERAREVLALGGLDTPSGLVALKEFDAWLRAAGHRRNPGTTADLVAASLFVALRQGILPLPNHRPWSAALQAISY